MSDAKHSGMSDHELLLEVRADVKDILRQLGHRPDRKEVYGVLVTVIMVGLTFAGLIL